MIFRVLLGWVIVGAIHFVMALLIDRFVIRPEKGTTRIFLASFMAFPFLGIAWFFVYNTVAPITWSVAFAVAFAGYLASLIPSALLWRIKRRRAQGSPEEEAKIFE